MGHVTVLAAALVVGIAGRHAVAPAASQDPGEVARLVGAMLSDTPLLRDLQELTDGIGGRPTGSSANRRAVAWALARLGEAGVEARAQPFRMPGLWLERSARARVEGEDVLFEPRIAAMPFSTGTPPEGMSAPLRSVGSGSKSDFEALGREALGAFLLVTTEELTDIEGLFREYDAAAAVEERAVRAGAAGLVVMGSRPNDLLYRHNVLAGLDNRHPMVVMERDGALRALRLLERGKTLTITTVLDLERGPSYQSENVLGEIRGSVLPREIVLIGAHLDSWDLGTGALDNGANVALVIDVARQIRRLGIRPARTIRFALWNGEEQGLHGSAAYMKSEEETLDGHVVSATFDIGCGRITGFFTNGRDELVPALDRLLAPVEGLGPFEHVNVPLVGTDNFDFLLQGIPNLVANQESATYGPNYHARSDEFGRCDGRQLRLNAAIVSALTLGFAQDRQTWPRHTRAQIEKLIRATDLERQMRTFHVWKDWTSGARGRRN